MSWMPGRRRCHAKKKMASQEDGKPRRSHACLPCSIARLGYRPHTANLAIVGLSSTTLLHPAPASQDATRCSTPRRLQECPCAVIPSPPHSPLLLTLSFPPPLPPCLPLATRSVPTKALSPPQHNLPPSSPPPPPPTEPTVARAYKQIPGPMFFVHMPLWYMSIPLFLLYVYVFPPQSRPPNLTHSPAHLPPPPPATPSVPALRGVARRGSTWWGALAIPALVVTVTVTAVTAATAVAYTETHTPSEDIARKCVWKTKKTKVSEKKPKFIKLGYARG
jgi:hypothetical protein